MARDIRFIPPNSLQHVVDSTYQGRYLLTPSDEVNDLVAGILGRAQRKYAMPICAVVVVSNHLHLLLRPKDAAHLSSFMSFFKTNVAKEVGRRLRGWEGRFFAGRYRSVTVSSEPVAQAAVLRYVLSHGPKEGLVDRVRDWPGIHSAGHLLAGRDIVGHWYDRTREYRDRGTRRKGPVPTQELVRLSPLPTFEHLPAKQWRDFVRQLVSEIDREWSAHRKQSGRDVLGVAKVLAMDPERRPAERKRTPKRRFHVADPKVLAALVALWQSVMVAYRAAARSFRLGIKGIEFPEGTFPPAPVFVPFSIGTLADSRGRPC